jgi:hypothetical protein
MPTVPTTFVPQVAPQAPGDIGQFQAPGVQAAENLAGPQLARFGQAMTGAGNAAFRLGSAIQDGIDDATTKQADVMGTTAMQRVADRFLGTVGQQSERDFEASMGELSQAGAAAMDTLKNDTQRAMYAPILARNMGMFQSRMQQHRNGQVRVWNTNEARARAQVNGDNAIFAYEQRDEVDENGREIGMIRYEAYVQTALDEARKAGELMGYAPGSAQMKLLEQEVNDRIAAGIVQSLVSQGKFADAQAFLDNEGTVEVLAPKAKEALNNSVQVKREASVINDLTDSIRETGTLNSKADPKTYGQEAKEGAEPPATLREALELADGIADPEVRKAVQSQLRTQYAQQDALVAQEYRAVLARRDEWVANPANNPAAFPQLDLLTQVDRSITMRMQNQKDDDDVRAEYAKNPDIVNQPGWIESKSGKVSPEMLMKLRGMTANPKQLAEATFDSDMLKRVLYDAGMTDVVDQDDSTNKRKYVTFSDNLSRAINVRQEVLGRKLTPDEKRDEAERLVMQFAQSAPKTFLGVDWLWPDTKLDMPISMMTPEQLSSIEEGTEYFRFGEKEFTLDEVQAATEILRRNNIPRPTIRETLMYLNAKGAGK